MRFILPPVFLFVGLAAGYHLGQRSPSSTAGAQSSSTAKAAQSASSTASAPGATSAPSVPTLAELSDDYSSKRGRRLAESLSVPEIIEGLKFLAGRNKDTGASSMRYTLISEWAKRDSKAAWEAVMAMPESADKLRLLGVVAAEVARKQPDAAVAMAMGLKQSGQRTAVLKGLFENWSRTDPNAAISHLIAHPELPIDGTSLSSLFSNAASKDPRVAADLALRAPQGSYGDLNMSSVMSRWIADDMKSALAWLDTLTDPMQQSRARKAFASSPGVSDPTVALQVAEKIAVADLRSEAMRSVLRNWLANDPLAVGKYIGSHGELQKVRGLDIWLGGAMDKLTAQEQNLFLNQLPEGEMKEGIVGGLVRNTTAKGNYQQAIAILNEMPDSRDRDRSLHDLAIKWGKADTKAVSAWIEQQPDSTDRDLIVAGYSHVVAGLDPKAAVKLAESIPDAKIRSSAVRNVFNRWRVANEAEAKAWLQQTPSISAAEKQLMERMPFISTDIVLTPTVGNRR